MSYYCKGEICPRAKKCLRATAWEMFPKNGTTDGVWFVPENTCIKNNYEDGVFETKEEALTYVEKQVTFFYLNREK